MSQALDISSAVSRVFDSSVDEYKYYVERMAQNLATRSESNIELMLLMAFDIFGMLGGNAKGRPIYFISPTDEPAVDGWPGPIVVTPQYKWMTYRIDFRLDFQFLNYPIFIECDGHDFHERTKEQAEHDRTKDRKIQEAGIPILRFTGREIFRDPMDCVNQVTKFISNRVPPK